MKPFSKWTIAEVEDQFQIVQHKQSDLLNDWLIIRFQPSQDEEKKLDTLRERLFEHVYDWNEYELSLKFIAPLLLMVDFDQDNYQSFFERQISVTFNGEQLSGTIDFIVARGKRIPKQPYFFIHGYKKELESPNDPLGQLMIAMIAAQKLNNDDNPIYGAYIVGRLWNFVVLDRLDYSVSLAYDATKDNIKEIFGILQNTKNIIEKFIQKTL